jgi:glycyl-tRNA synthetase beta chain
LARNAEPGAKFVLEAATAPEEAALGKALAALPPTQTLGPDHARAVASLRPAVDAMLDKVLIMAPEPAVRANRLALLREVAACAARFADLGRVAGSA